MTAVLENPPTTPDTDTAPDHSAAERHAEQVVTLTAEQVAQHPDNLRDPGRELDALARSIAEVGVLVPLIVVPVEQVAGEHEWPAGITHVAVDGNRRQAAAAKVGAPLPCLVRPDVADAKVTARTMAVTGLLRDGLTACEEARAVQTMLDLGLSAAAITKATGRSRDYVKTAKAAALVSDETAQIAASYAVTIDQLAELAEFTDDEDATGRLLDVAYDPGEWSHALAFERRERESVAAIAAKRAELETAGVRVLDDKLSWTLRLDSLTHDGEPITDEQHQDCPGRVVGLDYRRDEGVHVTEGCSDPDTHGHVSRYGSSFGRTDRSAETPEQTEARKAERRELIRLNKVADAAQDVRRQFCRDLLATKNKTTLGKMTGWAVDQILSRDRAVTGWLGDRSISSAPPLTEILGTDDPITTATTAPMSRRPLMVWAYVVAAHEFDYPRDAHRCPSNYRAAYLRHLVDLGYTPAETDRLVMGEQDLTDDDTGPQDNRETDPGV